jgi:hypothetical protein
MDKVHQPITTQYIHRRQNLSGFNKTILQYCNLQRTQNWSRRISHVSYLRFLSFWPYLNLFQFNYVVSELITLRNDVCVFLQLVNK